MLIIQNYKKLFFSFIKNDLHAWPETGNEVNSEPTEHLNFNQMFDEIFQDKTLDWNDLANLEQIRVRFEAEQTDIFDSTRENLNWVVEEMLDKWYTVNNREDFLALSNILKISSLNEELRNSFPQNYEEFVSKIWTDRFSLSMNYQENWFNVYNQRSIYKWQLWILMWWAFAPIDSIYRDSDWDNNEINDFRESEINISIWWNNHSVDVPSENTVDELDNSFEKTEEEKSDEELDLSYLDEFNNFEKWESEEQQVDFEPVEIPEVEESQEVDNDSQENEESQETQEINKYQKAENFYSRLWTTRVAMEELQALLILNGEDFPNYWADWYFGRETYDAIVNFQQKNNLTVDWLAGAQTLRALWIEQDTREFYSRVDSPEQREEQDTENTNFMNEIETSFMDWIWENISEWQESIRDWIYEVFRLNEDLNEFTWINWETINIEFDKDDFIIHVDTAFFDWVRDFPLTDLPENLNSMEDAKAYVERNIEEIKEKYDNQYLDNAINMVSRWRWSNYNIWSFEWFDWEQLNVKLHQSKDYENNFDWVYVNVSTPWNDWIRDYETRVDLLDWNWWELSREEVRSAVNEAIFKYRELYTQKQEEER